MKKLSTKFICLLLILGLNWIGLLAVNYTNAYYNDIETSEDNLYQAGVLDLSLRSGQDNFVPTGDMGPDDVLARDIYIKKEGSLPFQYNAHSEIGTSCDQILYDALQLRVTYNYYTATPTEPNYHENRVMELKYEGPLKDFNLRDLNPNDPELQIPNEYQYFENNFYGEEEHWFYATELFLPEDVTAELQNKSCQFNFVFKGWQTNMPDSSVGFTDSEKISSTISTGNWMPDVEVLYPDGGETWYLVPDNWVNSSSTVALCIGLGMNEKCQYPIRWQTTNPIGPESDLLIDIEFSADSGNNWMTTPVATGIENTGEYWWKPPYSDEYITDNGRMKVTATHKNYSFLTDTDISDEDYCPPKLDLDSAKALLGISDETTTASEPASSATTSTTTESTSTEEMIIENGTTTSSTTDSTIGTSSTEEASTSSDSTTSEPIIEDNSTSSSEKEENSTSSEEENNETTDETITKQEETVPETVEEPTGEETTTAEEPAKLDDEEPTEEETTTTEDNSSDENSEESSDSNETETSNNETNNEN